MVPGPEKEHHTWRLFLSCSLTQRYNSPPVLGDAEDTAQIELDSGLPLMGLILVMEADALLKFTQVLFNYVFP